MQCPFFVIQSIPEFFKQPNLNLESKFMLTTYFQGLVIVSQVAFESNIADTKINKIDSHFTIDK